MNSNKRWARLAGVLYLIIIICGIYAEFVVRSSLFVKDNASITAQNIIASESLFRSGIVSDIIMILADVAIALVFYVLFRSVNKSLSLMSAFFRLVQSTILGVNSLMLFIILGLLSGGIHLSAFTTEQLNAQAYLLFEIHGIGYSIGLVFFGVSIFILSYLIIKSGFIPKILGYLMGLASLGYLVNSFAQFLLPNYEELQSIFDYVVFIPAFIAELSLGLWLLIKGVKETTEGEIQALKEQD